ncbi:hypothetical protein C8B47_03670 [filamentous cyanobacterium CCP4]|nr:hypothetical protein C8B47_03670 [filamentous cyanobacterium CCP4]
MQITPKLAYGPHEKKLTKLCERLEVTPTQFTGDLYKLCRWMQDESKHYNLSISTIEKFNQDNPDDTLATYFLDTSILDDTIDGILYHADSRKFSGWGINKNPVIKSEKYECWSWERQWLENFAYLHPERANAIQNRIDTINKAHERKPQRNHNITALENLPTIEIAHRRELAKLMSIWMFSFRTYAGFRDTTYRWLQNIWEAQAYIMTAELEYRTAAEPEPRSSKKKTEAAKKDFRTAALWLTGVNTIYSDAFVELVKGADMPFDPSVNYDDLPKQIPEKAPVMKMGYTKLMNEFTRWVSLNEIDPDSFEGEDALMLKNKIHNTLRDALDDIRKPFARAKGQHVPVDEVSHEEA